MTPLTAPSHVRTLTTSDQEEGRRAVLREMLVQRGVNNVGFVLRDMKTDVEGAIRTVQYWDDQRTRKTAGLLVWLLRTGEVAGYQRHRGVSLDPHCEPPASLISAWSEIARELRAAVGDSTFRIWLAPLHPHGLAEDGAWRLACPEKTVGWVEQRFGRVIRVCAGREVALVACEAKS